MTLSFKPALERNAIVPAMDMISQEQALEQKPLGCREAACFWRESGYDDLECLTALFRTHEYKPHTHETYVIGTIVAGCERFELAGTHYAALPGKLCLINPDTVHDGSPEGEGYLYRMIYPSMKLIRDIMQDLNGTEPTGTVTFTEPVVDDPELSDAFIAAHRLMERKAAPLQTDEAMIGLVGRILMRHGKVAPAAGTGRERHAIRRAKDYLMENLAENTGLETLAGIAGLSRSHLIRSFRKETGFTPHAFVIDQRVHLARRLLLRGVSPLDVAVTAGFADQAHMTRAFKARIGVPPGVFARTM